MSSFIRRYNDEWKEPPMLLVIIVLLIAYIVWTSRTEEQKRPLTDKAEQVSHSLRKFTDRLPFSGAKRNQKRREQLTAWLHTHYLEAQTTDADAQALTEWLKTLSNDEFTSYVQRVTAVTESLGTPLDKALHATNPAHQAVLRLAMLTSWKSLTLNPATA
jgi:hypothetical protein